MLTASDGRGLHPGLEVWSCSERAWVRDQKDRVVVACRESGKRDAVEYVALRNRPGRQNVVADGEVKVFVGGRAVELAGRHAPRSPLDDCPFPAGTVVDHLERRVPLVGSSPIGRELLKDLEWTEEFRGKVKEEGLPGG